ncbi:hypothetical protein AX14_008078 [Amanita brunnescens Koide BX004]|nr:hypothetical protein AX14_008078 [Amanita brunnescens Koide BX004]
MLQDSPVKSSQADVLIIGAGPAGLMAGNALARAGINVRIIDKKLTRVTVGYADGIQPRTTEVFQSYGLGERLVREGNHIHTMTIYHPGPDGSIQLANVEAFVKAPNARYPFTITLAQGAIQAMLIESMSALGVEVGRAIVPASVHIAEDPKLLQDPASFPVQVTLKHLSPPVGEADTEIVHAKFVIGADGAHSWVRKSLNIEMEGEQTDYVWGVIDIVPITDFPHIRACAMVHSNNGSCMVIPREGDKVRLYVQLNPKDTINDATGRVDNSKFGQDEILEVARKSLQPYTIETSNECEWWTLYQIGQRVASRYSVNERVFIAGDACHTHSPKWGQGMNASMNDTHNLAWKLAYVIRGWAKMSLLKTYEFERRKYAEKLIEFDKEFARLFSEKPQTADNPNGVSHEVFLQAHTTAGGFASGTAVHYADSVIVNSKHQAHAQFLIIGQRVPPQTVVCAADGGPYELQDLLPSDSRFKVLIFAGDTLSAEQLGRVNVLADELLNEGGILSRYAPRDRDLSAIFDVLTVSMAPLKEIRVGDLPKSLRSHWSKVFVDDKDISGIHGGDAYAKFGINPFGVVVIVRPDGYVGMVAPLDNLHDIDIYFSSFMRHA